MAPDLRRRGAGLARSLGISLLVTLAVWAAFCWPLPRHLFDGITMSSRNIEQGHVRTMIPGDHLQLLYHFWLLGDALRGKSPPGRNVYEFNLGGGDDEAPRLDYFIPFALVYAAGEALGGRAFGWNFTVFVALWLSYWFAVLLLFRYTERRALAYLAALVGLVLPYRWIMLLGGSPTGFAILWPALLMLGLDVAVRDGRVLGGVLAAVAIVFSYMSDAHVFFFNALLTPAWCALALLRRGESWREILRAAPRLALALAPVAAGGLAGMLLSMRETAERFAGSSIAAGRTPQEVRLFSPSADGFVSWTATALSNQVFVGCALLLLLGLGLAAQAWGWSRDRRSGRANLVFVLLLWSGIAAVMLLALGPHGPFDGLAFRAVRKLIPHYDKIRQPGKIYGLMPVLLSLAACLTFDRLFALVRPVAARFATGLLLLGALVECRAQISPTICVLDDHQEAYAAVAEDARRQGVRPHVLVLPLWPGDSHEASTYEHYASLYRIRMVNGYSPVVKQTYLEKGFRQFESANIGWLDDAQLAALTKMGVRHILVHEDQYPEKVSPFPVSFLLRNLLEHPRLELLKKAERVWAFRILDRPRAVVPAAPDWPWLFPSRLYEVEKCSADRVEVVTDAAVSNGRFVRLTEPGSGVTTRTNRLMSVPGLRWLLRARGEGSIRVTQGPAETQADSSVAVATAEWAWFEIPAPPLSGFSPLTAGLTLVSGRVDLDVLLLAAGPALTLAPGESVTIPAPCFFHHGAIDPDRGTVTIQKARDPSAVAFYGPRLPLPAGEYECEVRFDSSAPAGVTLGQLGRSGGERTVPVVAGRPARLVFRQEHDLPVTLEFGFLRTGDLTVRDVVLHRRALEPRP